MIKRNQSKKQKRRQQNKAKREEEAMERNAQNAFQHEDNGNEATSIESDDEDASIDRPLVSSFAAFDIDSSDSSSGRSIE